MSQHEPSLTQDTIGALGEGEEQEEGYAGKECLISGSSVGRIVPIGCMRACCTLAYSHVSRWECYPYRGVSHACWPACLAHARMHRVVTLLQ